MLATFIKRAAWRVIRYEITLSNNQICVSRASRSQPGRPKPRRKNLFDVFIYVRVIDRSFVPLVKIDITTFHVPQPCTICNFCYAIRTYTRCCSWKNEISRVAPILVGRYRSEAKRDQTWTRESLSIEVQSCECWYVLCL